MTSERPNITIPSLQTAQDQLLAVGADTDQHDGNAGDFFDVLDIRLSVGGQVLERAGVRDVFLPAGQRVIHRLNFLQLGDRRGEVGQRRIARLV